MPAIPDAVGVVGGGRMGAGIAHVFLVAGSHVTLYEPGEAGARAAFERVDRSITHGVQRGALEGDPARLLSRLHVTTNLGAMADRELVMEAVPEDVSLKKRVLADLETVVTNECVLATNTSALSIEVLARSLRAPKRFLGLHFFNPVPASALVEVITGAQTASGVLADALGWITALGKQAISVRDSPGFATSRLGIALALESIRMLEDGVATADDIDTAMALGYGHPIGPLRLTDLVGLDVRLAIADHLSVELGPRFEAPSLLREMVGHGLLGRKTGQGFFDYR
jgi:3-hydroxybutyryl-CoA dehydrogenase